ncbi:MAG: ubiquinone/menaquinone biosynthesis protein, partial [Proteobacteria bacterium]
DDLAKQIEVDGRALGIHLGLLAALGFVERREGRWRATAVTRAWLLPQGEGYYGPVIHRYREGQPLHEQMVATLTTGLKATGHVSAAEEWERGELPVEMATWLTAFMNAHSRASSRGVAQQPLFADVRSLLDVGGGSGIFSIETARAWPQLAATVMEIPQVCDAARPYIEAAALGGRVRTQAVNMFTQDWPRGHDAHFFSNIFHDWSDTTCRLLARKSFEALPSGGRILLHEMLMDDDGCGPLPAAAFSVLMLLATRGRQYSLPELRNFLEEAGFRDIDAVRTGGGYYSLVSARKP